MDLFECIKTRLTVRHFKPDPVPVTIVERLLEAGRWSPSSRNQQPWHFIVIKDEDTLRTIGAIASSGRFVADAPLAIAIVMEENADSPALDAGRALQQMELVAWAEGMGTCFVGLETGQENMRVKTLLGIPNDLRLITILPFGYRSDRIKGISKSRKALARITHFERFGGAYSG